MFSTSSFSSIDVVARLLLTVIHEFAELLKGAVSPTALYRSVSIVGGIEGVKRTVNPG